MESKERAAEETSQRLDLLGCPTVLDALGKFRGLFVSSSWFGGAGGLVGRTQVHRFDLKS